MGQISKEQIKKQSESAYNQWCNQWRDHANKHSAYEMKSLNDFENIGIGRSCILVANGASLEKDIDALKEAHSDIMCCDKTLGTLLDHGIKPNYCFVADANVDYKKYLEPWRKQLGGTILFMNVCGNPRWTQESWADRYFLVNEDILKSEKEFSKISGCNNLIPAGTNVSNAMLVLLSRSDNTARKNFFGYDKYILTGYDYCWHPGGNYYAFSESGEGKHNYMRHAYGVDSEGQLCYSSNNLIFSAKWLEQYVSTFKLPVVQCSRGTLVPLTKQGVLKDHMKYNYKSEDKKIVKELQVDLAKLTDMTNQLQNKMKQISKDHFYSFLGSL